MGVLGDCSSADGTAGLAISTSMGSMEPVSSCRRRCASISAAPTGTGDAEDGACAGAGAGKGSGDVPDGAVGEYLLLFDPLDGSSNIEVNVSIGTIFSVLHMPEENRGVQESDFLQPGSRQVAAGYCIYDPQTTLVLTVGDGVASFTLDREQGSFILTQDDIRIPEDTREFAINMSNIS